MTPWELGFEDLKSGRRRYFAVRVIAGQKDYLCDESGRVTYRYSQRRMQEVIDRRNAKECA
jgi:hypothetical protein